jgi:3alpha(or 20beta)-hydroxysteroid dehydrogenase
MTKNVEGKVVLITGAARGLGAAHARAFVGAGAKVVFTDVLEPEGKALEAELGRSARFVKHDVRSAQQWDAAASVAEDTFGRLDVLVNNAGILLTKPLEEITEEEYRRVIDINQVGTFLGMKHVIAPLRRAGGGSIINISSIDGLRGTAGNSAYNASKFAVRGMTKSAALELAQYGIRVNSVHPGLIDTPMLQAEGAHDYIEAATHNVALGRIGQPIEISNLLIYLASDQSSYSTGAEFVADGGITARY